MQHKHKSLSSAMSASGDSLVRRAETFPTVQPRPRSTASTETRDSRERFIRPTPQRAKEILQKLVCDKMADRYDIAASYDKRIRSVIEEFSELAVKSRGVKGSLSDQSINTFMRAIENNIDPTILRTRPVEATGTATVQEAHEMMRNMSVESLTSIGSSDSDTTKSVKKVNRWQKHNKRLCCLPTLAPGVLWNKSNMSPQSIHQYGLHVIKEHVLEDHITHFELAVEQHEVELMNEKRAMEGKLAIGENDCVVVNSQVYVTGVQAELPCVMQTYDGEWEVMVMVLAHSSMCSCRNKQIRTFVVENRDTGHVMAQYDTVEMRFWNELGTATICMQYRDTTKQTMAPTIYFHLESISHCRLLAVMLTQ